MVNPIFYMLVLGKVTPSKVTRNDRTCHVYLKYSYNFHLLYLTKLIIII